MLEGAKLIGAGAATIALAGAAVGIGNVFSSLIQSVSRNPSLSKQLFDYAIFLVVFLILILFFVLYGEGLLEPTISECQPPKPSPSEGAGAGSSSSAYKLSTESLDAFNRFLDQKMEKAFPSHECKNPELIDSQMFLSLKRQINSLLENNQKNVTLSQLRECISSMDNDFDSIFSDFSKNGKESQLYILLKTKGYIH